MSDANQEIRQRLDRPFFWLGSRLIEAVDPNLGRSSSLKKQQLAKKKRKSAAKNKKEDSWRKDGVDRRLLLRVTLALKASKGPC